MMAPVADGDLVSLIRALSPEQRDVLTSIVRTLEMADATAAPTCHDGAWPLLGGSESVTPADESRRGQLSASMGLSEKLERCFTTMHPADRGPYSIREVAEGVTQLGIPLSDSYLWQLRKGHKDNPTVLQMQAIAQFFHVPMSYFFGTDEEVEKIDAQMALAEAMRAPAVRDIALRASHLTPAGLRAVAGILDELQGLPGITHRRRRRAVSDESGEPTEDV